MSEPVSWENYWKLQTRFDAEKTPLESIVLHGRRQLFIDNYVIEHMDPGLKKVFPRPVREPSNPVLREDKQWETGVGWASVIRDDEEGLWKAWYVTGRSVLCYATSSDGLEWEKPSLGLVDTEGGGANNLLNLDGVSASPTVFKDGSDPNPERRYKIFVLRKKPVYGMAVGFSSNGLEWQMKGEPVLTAANDPGLGDRPTMMPDPDNRRYIAFTKREMNNPYASGDWGMIHRTRCISFSDDFEMWTDPIPCLRADDLDPPDLQIYGLVGFRYESLYLGLMDMYWSRDTGPEERTMDIQLAVSRDGEAWWRAAERRTFLTYDQEKSWERFMVLPMNSAPVRDGEEIRIYYLGSGSRHRRGPVPEHRRGEPWLAPGHPEDPPAVSGELSSGMGLARLRVDGFAAVEAGSEEGSLWTKPVLFSGKELHINADAGRGTVRAQLYAVERADNRDSNSPVWHWMMTEPIPGFRVEDSVAVDSDSTDAVLRWRGGGNLERYVDRPVLIRFYIQNASLYSFWIE